MGDTVLRKRPQLGPCNKCPHPNCLWKCLPDCLSPTREDFLACFKIAPPVRAIAWQLRGKNCLAAIFASWHLDTSPGSLGSFKAVRGSHKSGKCEGSKTPKSGKEGFGVKKHPFPLPETSVSSQKNTHFPCGALQRNGDFIDSKCPFLGWWEMVFWLREKLGVFSIPFDPCTGQTDSQPERQKIARTAPKNFLIQQSRRVTSIGSLPPKTLGKSHGPPQNPAEPRRTLGETPAEPSERPRRALWEANFLGEPRGGLCPSDGDPPEL